MFTQKRDFTMPVIAIVGIFILTLLLDVSITPEKVFVKNENNSISKTASVMVPYIEKQHVYVIDQMAKNNVSVLFMIIQSKGFLVIQDENGVVLGVSHLLEQGLYTGGSIKLTKTATTGQELVASIYVDNGDEIFNAPKKDVSGGDKQDPITSSFLVL